MSGDDRAARVAVVTGAGRGIGAATAEALARRGFAVAVLARTRDGIAGTASRIEAGGGIARPYVCDVTRYEDIAATFAAIRRDLGAPLAIVNNAGVIEPIAPIADVDPARWARLVSINVAGPFNVVRAWLAGRDGAAAAAIVNLSSGAAHRPLEGWSAYCTSKAALAMLSRCIDLELRDEGVRVYSFQPGAVDTDMHVAIRASGINEVSKKARADLLDAGEPAEVIAWLCDEMPSDLQGTELRIGDEELRRRARSG